MRIACPSCAATYDVPDARLKPGKMVRCARCGGEWLPEQEPEQVTVSAGHARRADEQAGPKVPDDATAGDTTHEPDAVALRAPLTAMDRLSAPAAPPPPPRSLIGAWVVTALVLVAAISATIIWRQEFMNVWPPSSRILAPFGHEPPKSERISGKTEG